MSNRDTYRRVETAPGVYQCGCRWERHPDYGDILRQCALHQQHTLASVRRFERERAHALVAKEE